nr:aminoglycoside phosphotransferase family protein [Providencia sp. PROV267]
MAELDRERLLKWIIAWCGLSTAWCRKTLIINSSLHVTVANLMFYITLFKVTLLDVFNYLKSNLNLKLLPLNSGN